MSHVTTDRIQLIPVIELMPADFSTRTVPLAGNPEFQNEWTRYWLDSLADSGITGLRPIYPGSWHVATSEFRHLLMLELVLGVIFEDRGGVPTLNDPDCKPVLDGGLALLDSAGRLLVEPHCCGDLGNLNDWREAAKYREAGWQMLWIGHPWLSVRFDRGQLLISAPHESNVPVGKWAVDPDDLEHALGAAEAELHRFSELVVPFLSSHGFHGDAKAMAEKLVGLATAYNP